MKRQTIIENLTMKTIRTKRGALLSHKMPKMVTIIAMKRNMIAQKKSSKKSQPKKEMPMNKKRAMKKLMRPIKKNWPVRKNHQTARSKMSLDLKLHRTLIT